MIQGQVKIWCDGIDYCNNDEIVEWYDAYKKRKAQRAQIKEELISIAWHPTRMQGGCMTENEKKRITKCLLRKVRVSDSCFWLAHLSTLKSYDGFKI